TTTAFDALDRVVAQTTPDGSETTRTYNEGSLLEQVTVATPAGAPPVLVVASMDYNARGQRIRIAFGNETVTENSYEPDTFRLSRLLTTRRAGGALQDLTYEYDPVGNVAQISDGVSFGNPSVRGDGLYVYDPVYRLIKSEGREHPGQQPGP